MAPAKPDAATKTNARLLAEFFDAKQIYSLPWLGKQIGTDRALKNPQVRRTLRALAGI
jgi:hypothetical protein